MKKIEKLAKQLLKEYGLSFEKVQNPMAVGYGKDELFVYLWYNKLKSTLPKEYHGFKVNVRVTGVIKAL